MQHMPAAPPAGGALWCDLFPCFDTGILVMILLLQHPRQQQRQTTYAHCLVQLQPMEAVRKDHLCSSTYMHSHQPCSPPPLLCVCGGGGGRGCWAGPHCARHNPIQYLPTS
jgi:hypothetical protein